MFFIQRPSVFSHQPGGPASIDGAALRRFAISGGFVKSVGDPVSIVDGSAFSYTANTGWTEQTEHFGRAAVYYDDGATRRIGISTGNPGTRSFTLMTRFKLLAQPVSPGVVARSGSTGGGTFIPLWRNGTTFDMRVGGTDYAGAGTWNLGEWYDVDIVGSSTSCILDVNGSRIITGGVAANATIDPILCIGDVSGGGINAGELVLSHVLISSMPLSESARRAIRANPYQFFKRPDERIWIPVTAGAPAGAELAGNIQGEATVTGALTLQAVLEGAALGVATVSGSLTTQIPLAGALIGVATVGGELLTSIPLAGDIVGQALASGSLTAQIQLDGAVIAQAAIAAGLSSAIQLAGAVDGQAAVSGALTGGSSGLEGAIAGQANVVATLTTSIKFSGSIAAQAGIAGVLTTAIPLTAEVLAQAIVTGQLTVPILLAGAIDGQAAVSGTLSDTVPVVNYRLTPSLVRLAKVRAGAERLTRASVTHQRLATLIHGVAHV